MLLAQYLLAAPPRISAPGKPAARLPTNWAASFGIRWSMRPAQHPRRCQVLRRCGRWLGDGWM